MILVLKFPEKVCCFHRERQILLIQVTFSKSVSHPDIPAEFSPTLLAVLGGVGGGCLIFLFGWFILV